MKFGSIHFKTLKDYDRRNCFYVMMVIMAMILHVNPK